LLSQEFGTLPNHSTNNYDNHTLIIIFYLNKMASRHLKVEETKLTIRPNLKMLNNLFLYPDEYPSSDEPDMGDSDDEEKEAGKKEDDEDEILEDEDEKIE